jgi:NhaP-type Na+/H+ or K+/H+ antiporter
MMSHGWDLEQIVTTLLTAVVVGALVGLIAARMPDRGRRG